MIYGIVAVLVGLVVLAAGQAFVSKDSSQAVQNFSMGTAFYAWIGSFVLLVITAYLKTKLPVKMESSDSVLDS
ncbi:MAG: hypothetical protein IPM77_03000 [Crocinitomicaceae bacterium]|nr:hypothetical protein [Crocinitomicaceae bacterium]